MQSHVIKAREGLKSALLPLIIRFELLVAAREASDTSLGPLIDFRADGVALNQPIDAIFTLRPISHM
jgi:hypothetical protein